MINHDLSPNAVGRMTRVDLSTVTEEPTSPIGEFEFHGCTCGVAAAIGSSPWELHRQGDELLHVLAGETTLTIREDDDDDVRVLRAGDLVVVPRNRWHRTEAPVGVTMLFMTPNAGNAHSWSDPPTT